MTDPTKDALPIVGWVKDQPPFMPDFLVARHTPGKSYKPLAYHAQATARIADLSAEIVRLTACLKTSNENAERFEREWYMRGDVLEKAEAALVEARRDAERYRWLRDEANSYREDAPQVVITDWMGMIVSTLPSAYPQGEALDAALDAARASAGAGTGGEHA